mgnify:CR=1 FL=1
MTSTFSSLDVSAFTSAADRILAEAVTGDARVPGVVAMVTDRDRTVYSGAAGQRSLGGSAPMATDDVFAIFSNTKAITATAALQLVEEGLLDLDAPASTYAPAIGTLQVIEGFDDEMRSSQERVFASLSLDEQDQLLELLERVIRESEIPASPPPPQRGRDRSAPEGPDRSPR